MVDRGDAVDMCSKVVSAPVFDEPDRRRWFAVDAVLADYVDQLGLWTEHAQLTYLPKIFFRDGSSVDHRNTLTSCSELRGFGLGKLMISLKKELVSSFNFATVSGVKPSRFRRIRFFSSTVKWTATKASNSAIVSTLVIKYSFCSFQ